jgi:hypothetical protein
MSDMLKISVLCGRLVVSAYKKNNKNRVFKFFNVSLRVEKKEESLTIKSTIY